MVEHAACEQGGQGGCGEACPLAGPSSPVSVSAALARFEREAIPGEFHTGRYRMRYYSWGAGPPLLLIHGVADTSRSFLLPASVLSAQFRCIAYDLPTGHGDEARMWRYSHEDLAQDVVALLEHLKLDRAYVLGASFGSTIALRAMRMYPERLPRGILQGGLAQRRLRGLEAFFSGLFRFLPGPTSNLPRRERMLALVQKKAFEQVPEENWRAFVEWTATAKLSALGHQAILLGRTDLRPELPHIRQPVLIVHGEYDSVSPRAQADLLLASLPNAGLAVLEGAGHVPSYSHPEALAAVVKRFLTPPGKTCEKHPDPGESNRVALL